MTETPYATPKADLSTAATTRHYGGLRRLPYFGIGIVLQLAQIGLAATGNEGLILAGLGVGIIGAIVTAVLRTQNIGGNKWWGLLIIVPLANLIIAVRCLIYPEGYADTRELDTAGKVIAGILALAVLLVVAAAVIPSVMA